MPYDPTPIDTSGVVLPADLDALTDGWTHGPTWNDAAKSHPCLVAYDELPESEKK